MHVSSQPLLCLLAPHLCSAGPFSQGGPAVASSQASAFGRKMMAAAA